MSAIRKMITGLAIAMIFPLCAFGQPALTQYIPDPTNALTPTLEWSGVSGATNYRLQVDDESSFTAPMIISGQDTGTTTGYTGSLPEGDIYWRVGSDADGYATYSDHDHFVIDRTAPSLTINAVTSPTDVDGQMVSGTVESGAYVTVTSPATEGPVSLPGNGTWSCTLTNLVEGANLITVTATDGAANETTRTATIDYEPSVSITLTINTVTSPTSITSQTITGTKDTDATITSVETDTAAVAGTISYPTTDTWSCEITGLADGANNITVTAQNATDTATRLATIVYDTTPAGSLSVIPYTPDPTTDLTPTLQWNAVSGATNYMVQADDEPTFNTPHLITGQYSATTTYTTPSLQEGDVYWRVSSNVEGFDVFSPYDHFVIDVTPPTLTVNAVETPTNQPSQTVTGSMESGATVTVASSATPGTVTYPSATTWSCNVSGFAEGNNSVTVTATDAAGNEATESATIEYQAASFTLTINAVTSPTGVSSQTISGTMDSDVTITLVDVDTAASAGTVSYLTTTTWECTITGLVEGDNTVTVTGQNAAMEETTRTAVINYDTTIPSVTINTVVSPTSTDNQIITGTMEAQSTITVDIDTAATAGAVSYPTATTWSCLVTGFEPGANIITVTATDQAMNTAQETAVIEYQLAGLTLTIDAVTSPTTVNSQTVTGTADTGAAVTVSVDTAATTGPVTRNGTAWSCVISNLVQGDNTISVHAEYASQTADRTTIISFDDTPPTFTIDAVVSPTNVDSQTISGTMEAGSTIEVTVDTAASAGVASYPTSTTWSCTITGLVDGWNNITVIASDALDNQSSGMAGIQYDSTAPTISIDPVDTPTNDAGQQITGGRETGRPVSIIASGATVSGLTYPDEESWACTVTVNNTGQDTTVNISATVTDLASNSATATASIVYDQTPPALSVDPVVSPTNENYQVVTGTMEAGADVYVNVPNASAGSVSTTQTTWSCPVSGIVVEGGYDVFATAWDAAGNIAYAGATIVYDRTPPNISVNGLPQYTNLNTVTLQGSREIGSTVTVEADTTASIGIVSYPSGTTWQCQVGNLEERLNVMTATATDAAGNSMSASVSTTYDGTEPFLAIDAVTTPTNENSQSVCGSRENDLAVFVTTNTTATAGFVTYPSPTTWCCIISNLEETNNTITVSSTDLANNTGTAETIIRYDATPPFVSIYQVASPTNVNTQDIEGAMELGAQITVTVDTGAGVQNLVVSDISWACTVSGMLEMNNVVTATATDEAGNTASANATIRYDITPPAVAIDAVATPTRMITQTLTGTMEAGAKVALAADTAATFGNVTYPTATTWSCDVQSLRVGANTITATATDLAGNSGEAVATIMYYEVWPGDVNNDDVIDLTDAILALQVCAGLSVPVDPRADLDGDGKIGIREAVHALQSGAGLR